MVCVFPGTHSWPWPSAPVSGSGPQFVITSPCLQFVFTGLGPQFAFTGPGPNYVFTSPVFQFVFTSASSQFAFTGPGAKFVFTGSDQKCASTTILDKIFGAKWGNPAKLGRSRKV